MEELDETLRRACEGRASSAGGLNVSELKSKLVKIFPNERDRIMSSKRTELQNSKWCLEVRDKIRDLEKQRYPKIEGEYTEQDKKNCRCQAHVALKGQVDSIYGVCNSRVGHTPGKVLRCADYFQTEYILSDEEISALAKYKGKDPNSYKQELYPSRS